MVDAISSIDNVIKVVIVGKANVGKSTIFNSLIGEKKSVVYNRAGITKDAIEHILKTEFGLVKLYDTAGAIEKCVFDDYTKKLIYDSDIIFLILADSVTPIDKELFTYLIKNKRNDARIVGVINKSDRKDSNSDTFFSLYLPELIRISAEHRSNLWQMFDIIQEEFEKKYSNKSNADIDNSIFTDVSDNSDNDSSLYEDIEIAKVKQNDVEDQKKSDTKKSFSIVIIGTPNVGKSTFLNTAIGFERVRTEDKPGTTIDSIDITFNYKGVDILIVDTPGIRKKHNIYDEVEKKSVLSAFTNIRKADVVINMFEIGTILTKQDLTLISYAVDMLKPTILIANKYDRIVVEKDKKKAKQYIDSQLKCSSIKDIDVIYTTVLKQKNCFAILDRIVNLYQAQYVRISTSRLNNWLRATVLYHEHPLSKKTKRKMNFKYVVQIDNNPIKLVIHTNFADTVLDSYKSYLKTSFRTYFKLPMIPIKLIFRTSHNPYHA